MPTGEFVAGGIKNESAHILRAKKFFQIVVDAALSTSLVGIHRLRQSLRRLILDSMPRRTQGNRDHDRQHRRQRQRCPERQEDLQEKAFHCSLFLAFGS